MSFVEATDRMLLRRTAEHLDALADELTTRITVYFGTERGKRELVEQRAKCYRISHDLRELSDGAPR